MTKFKDSGRKKRKADKSPIRAGKENRSPKRPFPFFSCPECGAAVSPGMRAYHQRKCQAKSSVRQKTKSLPHLRPEQSRAIARCHECGAEVMPDRLRHHLRKIHQVTTESAVSARHGHHRPVDRISRLVNRIRKSRGPERVCGDCLRAYPASKYDLHRCRTPSTSVYTVSGGSPGGGKRR